MRRILKWLAMAQVLSLAPTREDLESDDEISDAVIGSSRNLIEEDLQQDPLETTNAALVRRRISSSLMLLVGEGRQKTIKVCDALQIHLSECHLIPAHTFKIYIWCKMWVGSCLILDTLEHMTHPKISTVFEKNQESGVAYKVGQMLNRYKDTSWRRREQRRGSRNRCLWVWGVGCGVWGVGCGVWGWVMCDGWQRLTARFNWIRIARLSLHFEFLWCWPGMDAVLSLHEPLYISWFQDFLRDLIFDSNLLVDSRRQLESDLICART